MRPKKTSFKWQNWLYFNNAEKKATLILLLLCIILCIFPFCYQWLFKPNFNLKIDHVLVNQLAKNPMPSQVDDERPIYEEIYSGKKIDINEATWIDLTKSGIDKRMASKIINYRKAIGGFTDRNQIFKTYGITASQISQLEAKFILPEKAVTQNSDQKSKVKSLKVKALIEINDSDSAALTTIKGIGPAFASRIIRYRNNLGGYQNMAQLKEIYGMADSIYDKISSQMSCNGIIKKIEINKLPADFYLKHPYLPSKKAYLLKNYQKQHAVIPNAASFKMACMLDQESLDKLLPYLDFNY